MIDTTLTLTDDFTAGLDKLVDDVQTKVLFSGAAAMALVFYDEARLQAEKHVKTGTLRDAIYRVYSKDDSTAEKVVYEVSWNHEKAPYAHILEFGSSRAPAYPFLRPAYAQADAAVAAGMARMTQRMDEITGGSK